MQIYELSARFDSRKSFYSKAHVIELDNGNIQLQSYDTIVGEIIDGKYYQIWEGKSQTTTRHIKEFKKQFLEV